MPSHALQGGGTLVAEARLDNRVEIAERLGLSPARRRELPDAALVALAYDAWGPGCGAWLLGAWAYVAWDAAARRAVLSRDAMGFASLYYHVAPDRIWFANRLPALVGLAKLPRHLDAVALAQLGLGTKRDTRCFVKGAHKAPPAQALLFDGDGGMRRLRYWDPGEAPDVRHAGDAAYREAFVALYDDAVACQLDRPGPIGIALSGGLDSGSVAALAAPRLAARGSRLPAYSWIPDPALGLDVMAGRKPHELEDVRSLAGHVGNIDVTPVPGYRTTPLAAVRWMLAVTDDLSNPLAGWSWLHSLLARAGQDGIGTLLTGDFGNLTISRDSTPARGLRRLRDAAGKAMARVERRAAPARAAPDPPRFHAADAAARRARRSGAERTLAARRTALALVLQPPPFRRPDDFMRIRRGLRIGAERAHGGPPHRRLLPRHPSRSACPGPGEAHAGPARLRRQDAARGAVEFGQGPSRQRLHRGAGEGAGRSDGDTRSGIAVADRPRGARPALARGQGRRARPRRDAARHDLGGPAHARAGLCHVPGDIRGRERRLMHASAALSLVLILGMHRSGTSCLAGALEQCGLFLGEVRRTGTHNPKGYFEPAALVRVHDRILALNGGSWHRPPRRVPVHPGLEAPLSAAVRTLATRTPCGIKDPRLLLIDGWEDAAGASVRCVGTFRHPMAVAASLQRRNGMGAGDALDLWLEYNRRLVERHRRRPFPLIAYDLASPRSLSPRGRRDRGGAGAPPGTVAAAMVRGAAARPSRRGCRAGARRLPGSL
ncbi:MAG: asparagine synthase-related protein [Sphingomonas sp.]